VLGFTLSGLLVLVLVGFLGVLGLRRIATAEAMDEARDLTRVAGRGIVQPRLRDSIVRGDAAALTELDAIVNQTVLLDPIVRVKLWRADGRIVYSDVPELIGSTFELGPDQREVLRTNGIEAELSDLSGPENRYEAPFGELLEVYLPVRTPGGEPLLFEVYMRFDSVAASGQQLWRAFLPALATALIALTAIQVPLAYRLARRVRDAQRDRERLLQRAVDASDTERRRIAGDLHDGPVQQLAGLSMTLAARADGFQASDPAAAEALDDAATRMRQGVRSLRSALMGIYPPSLQRAGLPAALADLIAPLEQDGIEATLEVPDDLSVPPEIAALFFRTAQESIRNVVSHARADHVWIRVRSDDRRAEIEIRDDGRGFVPERVSEAEAEGHLGLRLLEDRANDVGGRLLVDSDPGAGTRIRLEVPSP
jgi:signal transduction histidine kinase